MRPKVGVILINWNAGQMTRDCLWDLLPELLATDVVCVLDNGSEDDSLAILLGVDDPRVRLIATGENTGFAHAVNRGVAEVFALGAEALLLLNNDARLKRGALGALISAWQRRPEAGLYGPRIYEDRQEQRFWCCGVSLGGPNLCRLRGHGKKDDGRAYRREEVVDSLTGAVLLIPRETIERVGPLDEGYFVYVEDADFCARARVQGYTPLYVPDAIAYHAGSGASGGGYSPLRKYLTAHGSVRYLRQHGTLGLWFGFWLYEVLLMPLVWLRARLRGEGQAAAWKWRGTWDGLAGRPVDRTLPARARSQSRALARSGGAAPTRDP